MIFDAAAMAGKFFRQFWGSCGKLGGIFFGKAAQLPKTRFLQQKKHLKENRRKQAQKGFYSELAAGSLAVKSNHFSSFALF